MRDQPKCPYCGCMSELVDGSVIHPHLDYLKYRKYYMCNPCGAYVVCNKGTLVPMGTLANGNLRSLRRMVYGVLDLYLKNGGMSKKEAYYRLFEDMGANSDECHVELFGEEECVQALGVLRHWEGTDGQPGV